jgi:SRSO17 transposase
MLIQFDKCPWIPIFIALGICKNGMTVMDPSVFRGIRWAIEQCFEETKTELGMDQ